MLKINLIASGVYFYHTYILPKKTTLKYKYQLASYFKYEMFKRLYNPCLFFTFFLTS